MHSTTGERIHVEKSSIVSIYPVTFDQCVIKPSFFNNEDNSIPDNDDSFIECLRERAIAASQ